MAEHIIERPAEEMYIQDQALYSVIVNRKRAIPSVIDGLKVVQRRILYGAYDKGFRDANHIGKSAQLEGHVMGEFHPHSGAYPAMVTLAAWYKIKYPLLYASGNWGTVSGAPAAAQRYTEVALNKFGYEVMIEDMTKAKNVVDWIDTYTLKTKEPEYLAAKLPILLINGADGIGVGLSIKLPSHNLGEVVDATIDLINNPNKDVVLIPDFIQPCELIGDNSTWKAMSKGGRGSFKIRGKITESYDKKGNCTLHITSLPDNVTTTAIHNKIVDMVSAKQLPMVKDCNAVLNKGKPDIIIELKQGSDVNYVKQAIYAKTDVQVTFSSNFEAVTPDGLSIRRYSYKDYLNIFIAQRSNTKFRYYCNLLNQVMTRHMHVDAFVKVLGSKYLDKIIDMIRKYNGTDEKPIIEYIIKTCNVTDIQAKFIIDRRLPQLSAGYLKDYIKERKELEVKIKNYKAFVTDDRKIKEDIIKELLDLKEKYNTPRLCKVIKHNDIDDIPSGTFKIVITERNFIRKIPDNDKVGVVRKDNPKFVIRVDNAENILIFDNKGKVFNLPVHKIPISDKTSAGTDVRMLIKTLTSDIAAVFYEPLIGQIHKSGNKHYLAVLTKSNTIKKLDLEDFLNVGPSGLMYSKIKPEDEVVGVTIVPHNLDIAISSGQKVLRCKFKDVPLYKRNASGVRAMNTNEPINGLSVFYPDSTEIVAITKKGKFNKFDIQLLECNARGKQGHKVIKLDSNDEILNVFGVNESDIIRVLTSDSVEEIKVSDIKKGKSHLVSGIKMISSSSVIIRADVMKTK